MTDNIDLIKPFLKFRNEDDFYYLQILQRKKENPTLKSNSRVIKNYYIDSIEYLERIYPEVKMLCDNFNARAMLRLNVRSFKIVGLKNIQNTGNCIANGYHKDIKKCYDRACGKGHNADSNSTYWIVDLDNKDHTNNVIPDEYVEDMKLYINTLRPTDKEDKALTTIKSLNGLHLVTRPFQLDAFNLIYPLVDAHKDNPTNLYIPSIK